MMSFYSQLLDDESQAMGPDDYAVVIAKLGGIAQQDEGLVVQRAPVREQGDLQVDVRKCRVPDENSIITNCRKIFTASYTELWEKHLLCPQCRAS